MLMNYLEYLIRNLETMYSKRNFLYFITVVIKTHASTTVTDKVRNRLEQLDDFEEGSVQEMLNLSQQDYVKRIEELNQQLITAWENDQRVKALKIVIQVWATNMYSIICILCGTSIL